MTTTPVLLRDGESQLARERADQHSDRSVSSDSCVVNILALLRQLQQADELQGETSEQHLALRPSMGLPWHPDTALRPPPAARLDEDDRQQAMPTAAHTGSSTSQLQSSSGTQTVPECGICLPADPQTQAAPECRICLSVEPQKDLIQPCYCRGTLSTTHTLCLAAWAAERGSLVCELCGQHYKHDYAELLEPVVKAVQERRKRVAQQAAMRASSSSSNDAPRGRYQLSRQDWCCVLLSLFMLMVSFAVISATLVRRTADSHPAHTGWSP